MDEDSDVAAAGLVGRLRGGDKDALAEAFERWGPMVHTIALRSSGNHHDAEDITQQVFVSAWRSRESLRDDAGSLGGWLAAITRRRCVDLYRSRARERRNETAVAVVIESEVPGHGDRVTEQVLLAQELLDMGDPRATVIRLAIIEDRPYEDIARILDMPLGTVKSHVRRGLRSLRVRLEEVKP